MGVVEVGEGVLVVGGKGVLVTVYRGECDGATIGDEESPLFRCAEDVGCAEDDDECSGVVSIESGSASAST